MGPWEKYQTAETPGEGPWSKFAASEEPAPVEQPELPPLRQEDFPTMEAYRQAVVNAGPGGGLKRGLRDVVDAGAQLVTRGLEAVAPAGSAFDGWIKGERRKVEDINREAEREYQQDWRRGNAPSFDASRMVGNVVGALPFANLVPPGTTLPRQIASGAAQGATFGALQPVADTDNFWEEKAGQTGYGAGLGGAGSALFGTIGKMLAPETRPEVQTLMQKGVTPTPGQILGGGAQRLEEGATSIPFVGDVVKAGQRRAIEDFNRASINEALGNIGAKLPDELSAGRDAVKFAGETISKSYDDLLPKLTGQADEIFLKEIQSLRGLASEMPPSRVQQFDQILRDRVLSQINPQTGKISGDALKGIQTRLGNLASAYGKSTNADERLLGDALKETLSSIRGLIERSNPAQAEALSGIDKAYATLLRVENAAGRSGSKEGVFSPSALNAASRQLDQSLRKRAFTRGDALMQDFADAGEKVLGPKVPDSGTPYRLAAGAGLFAAPMFIDPVTGAAAAATGAMYSSPGQRLAAALLTKRPQSVRALGEGARGLTPYAAALAAALNNPSP